MAKRENGKRAGADYRLGADDAVSAMRRVVDSGRVPMLWGPPGIGKTASARRLAEEMGAEYVDVRANLLDPVDVRGIPRVVDGRTRWAPPEFFPREEERGSWLICFDELSAALPSVQAALYQVLLDRRIGEAVLPDGVRMMAAGNEEGDGAVSYRMGTATANRLQHVYMDVDVDGWLDWAVDADVAPEVLFFIKFRPALLHDFDPRRKSHAFATPRTWEFVSDNVKQSANGAGRVSAPAERALYCGTVGDSAGMEFVAFLRIWRELPHPQTIIDNPTTARIPEDPSAQVALCGSLWRMADEDTFDAVVTYAARDDQRAEIGHFLITQCVKKSPRLQYSKAYVDWASKQHA